MPVIQIRISKRINHQQERELAEQLGKAVEIVPNKYYEKTMVIIEEDCRIYRSGQRTESAFLEIRFNEEIAFDHKQAYISKAFEIVKSILGISYDNMYVNILELKHNWGSRGVLK